MNGDSLCLSCTRRWNYAMLIGEGDPFWIILCSTFVKLLWWAVRSLMITNRNGQMCMKFIHHARARQHINKITIFRSCSRVCNIVIIMVFYYNFCSLLFPLFLLIFFVLILRLIVVNVCIYLCPRNCIVYLLMFLLRVYFG